MSRRVYGRTFEEPSATNADGRLRGHGGGLSAAVAGAVPGYGIGVLIGAAISSASLSNRRGAREAAWRAFVVGSLLQVLSLGVVWIMYPSIRFTWVAG